MECPHMGGLILDMTDHADTKPLRTFQKISHDTGGNGFHLRGLQLVRFRAKRRTGNSGLKYTVLGRSSEQIKMRRSSRSRAIFGNTSTTCKLLCFSFNRDEFHSQSQPDARALISVRTLRGSESRQNRSSVLAVAGQVSPHHDLLC
jgi:hypothetical protein